ncbi:hypothetical protein [Microbispora sp. GKU 823]|uniref:hypothetical protein n=1 Tax=Microbispora sp. GKU 823 TaxID=1652100 RepID=UPI0009A3B039|nr:hypothetical protein [Microbispora sp. GKU 823]OPG14708.1 hypothetical protein B1L11_00685 [Microbispora sp. GKU 823]
MTFPPDDEYGELLRRALRAEADSVVPSPEGLEIIRGRIEQRGLRGLRNMLWWRVGAAAAGAVLVAGAVVMVVPGLRDQVAQSTGIAPAGDEREDERDTSSVSRPPNLAPSRPAVIVPVTPSPSRGRPAPSPTHRVGATTRPSPSPSDPCVTPTPQPGVDRARRGPPADVLADVGDAAARGDALGLAPSLDGSAHVRARGHPEHDAHGDGHDRLGDRDAHSLTRSARHPGV